MSISQDDDYSRLNGHHIKVTLEVDDFYRPKDELFKKAFEHTLMQSKLKVDSDSTKMITNIVIDGSLQFYDAQMKTVHLLNIRNKKEEAGKAKKTAEAHARKYLRVCPTCGLSPSECNVTSGKIRMHGVKIPWEIFE